MDQLTEVDMLAENELICEKLLGWHRHPDYKGRWWFPGNPCSSTPSFETWDMAGRILDAFAPLGGSVVMYVPHHEHKWSCSPPGGRNVRVMDADTGPLAIRAAALEYIKTVKL